MSGLPSKPNAEPLEPKKPAPSLSDLKPQRVFEHLGFDDDESDAFEKGPIANDYTDEAFTRSEAKSDTFHIDELLEYVISQKAADLHLTAGSKPMFRLRGEIKAIPGYSQLSQREVERLIKEILSNENSDKFAESHELNFAYSLDGKGRFRVNVFQQRGTMAAVLRYIPNEIIPLENLNMPEAIADFAEFPRGLVLITGPTGSGKSTTLASIINKINTDRAAHIITIEDPIEFMHENKQSILNQREVGVDTNSFKEALVNALRQDPDVIMLGEMRDLDTIQAALTAAETGHLVFATLHTQSVSETMSRIIDVFPVGAKEQVRGQLAATLQAIACQTLMKTLDGKGMVAAVEILKADNAIRSLIRKNQDEQIRTMMETKKGMGMQTLDSHLIDLVKNNIIDVDDALYKGTNADIIINALGGEQAVSKIRRTQAGLGGAKA